MHESTLYPSFIELSKSSLEHNLRFLRELIGERPVFSSVIKGNAYGHGIDHFVPLAEQCGVRHFSVFSSDEAKRAAEAVTENSHIMIMGMISNDALEWAIRRDISFFVFEKDRLEHAISAAAGLGKPARIHLHLETGMNRLGFNENDLEDAVELILNNSEYCEVEGVCTHFAGAESISNHVRVQNQIDRFRQLNEKLESEGIKAKYRHTACSAAVFNYPETIMDLVRVGIAQYGFWPNRETCMNFMKKNGLNEEEMQINDPLDRVLAWKSVVMSTKTVESGEFVGYGNIYLTSRRQKIATVPIGYSHGFGRNLTNTGRVLINGERAEVAGLVNMNMLTVDVTDIPNVAKGDEVVIIGKQGEQEMTVASFSEMQNYMNYEVLVRIPSKLPRYIVE